MSVRKTYDQVLSWNTKIDLEQFSQEDLCMVQDMLSTALVNLKVNSEDK